MAPSRLGADARLTPRQIAVAVIAEAPVSPLDQVPFHEDLQEHSAAELAAMLDAMERLPDVHLFTTDQPHWIVVLFTCRADKEAALTAAGLFDHGDKYLDGYVVAEQLGISMK